MIPPPGNFRNKNTKKCISRKREKAKLFLLDLLGAGERGEGGGRDRGGWCVGDTLVMSSLEPRFVTEAPNEQAGKLRAPGIPVPSSLLAGTHLLD